MLLAWWIACTKDLAWAVLFFGRIFRLSKGLRVHTVLSVDVEMEGKSLVIKQGLHTLSYKDIQELHLKLRLQSVKPKDPFSSFHPFYPETRSPEHLAETETGKLWKSLLTGTAAHSVEHTDMQARVLSHRGLGFEFH